MQEYEISGETIALIENNNKTIVYENDEEFIVNKYPNQIMEESCAYFGSSLLGRQKGTINLIGVSHKSPIIVEEENEIIFFPTSSPRLKSCCWISLKNIKKYYKKGDRVIVEYTNGKEIELDISYGILDNQILRASRLESTLRNRKKNSKKL